jgi:hypothetical protein
MIEETAVNHTLQNLAAAAKAEYDAYQFDADLRHNAKLAQATRRMLVDIEPSLDDRIEIVNRFAIVDGIKFTTVLFEGSEQFVMEGICPQCGETTFSDPIFCFWDAALLLDNFIPEDRHWWHCDHHLGSSATKEPTLDLLVDLAYAVLAETRKDLDVAREDYDTERRSLEISKNNALLDGSYQALGSNDKTRDAALREQVLVVRYEMLDVAEREYHKAQLAHDLARYEVEALRMQVALQGGG